MAKTASTMLLPLGTQAPFFSLMDIVSGTQVNLSKPSNFKATVIMFICNHCPYVKYINHELVKLAQDYQDRGVQFFAINSNDVEHYPDDSPEKMKETAIALHYPFPYLYDETQEVAMAYKAACTPDFFVFDEDLQLIYRGQLDDSRPGNDIEVTGECIRFVLDNLLLNQPITINQKPSLGCNIKWKK